MDVWVKTRELIGSIADVTQAGSKIARYKIEVANLDRKLTLALRKIGERTFRMDAEGTKDVLADPAVRAAIEEVSRMKVRMEAIHREVERHKGEATSRIEKTSKMVREDVDRASEAVRREAERAAGIIREETSRAASALKKAVEEKTSGKKKRPSKETSDLQP